MSACVCACVCVRVRVRVREKEIAESVCESISLYAIREPE